MPDRLPVATRRDLVAHVRRAIGRDARTLVPATAALLIGAFCGAVPAVGLGLIVDLIVAGDAGVASVVRLAVVMLAAVVADAVFSAVGFALTARVLTITVTRLRDRTISAAYRIPRQRIERAGTGDLIARTSDDVSAVSAAIGTVTPALTSALFAIIASFTAMAVIDPWFALALVAIVPVHAYALARYLRSAPSVYLAERAALSDRSGHLIETFSALPTLHAFGGLTRQHARIDEGSWTVAVRTLLTQRVQNAFFARLNAAELAGMAALLLIGFAGVSRDAMTVGGVTAAMLLFLRLFGPIGSVLFVADQVQSAVASLSRIVGVSIAAEEEDARGAAQRGDAEAGPGARLHEVSFAYHDDHPVLHGIRLRVPPGATVALVGPSGSGKSTLAAVLAGALEPSDGEAVRPERTMLVTQEAHVFRGTLRENLLLARPDATAAEVGTALRVVGAEHLARLDDAGLDAEVGAGGMPLAPADAQLLALARVAVADADLVILDEPTAEAGSAAAGVLDAAARAVLRGRTALVVTHRLAQAEDADIVVVLEDGRIVEQGRPDDLRRAGGRFAALFPDA